MHTSTLILHSPLDLHTMHTAAFCLSIWCGSNFIFFFLHWCACLCMFKSAYNGHELPFLILLVAWHGFLTVFSTAFAWFFLSIFWNFISKKWKIQINSQLFFSAASWSTNTHKFHRNKRITDIMHFFSSLSSLSPFLPPRVCLFLKQWKNV